MMGEGDVIQIYFTIISIYLFIFNNFSNFYYSIYKYS